MTTYFYCVFLWCVFFAGGLVLPPGLAVFLWALECGPENCGFSLNAFIKEMMENEKKLYKVKAFKLPRNVSKSGRAFRLDP